MRPACPQKDIHMPATSVLDLIGKTPLVEITRFDLGPCRLFLKLESANPSGSIKDRPARAMIDAAEADGRLKEGGTVVEATAGNTGVGLALVASRKGYPTVLVVPDKMSREKILHARALGAEVIVTRSDVGKGHPDYYQDLALAITERTPGAFYANQFANPANPAAHEATTAPEILAEMGGDLDAVVVGVGSGGTLTGVGRYKRKASPKTKMVLADPAARCWRRSSRPESWARPAPGPWKASARISCRRTAIFRWSRKPTRSPTRRASALLATFCGRRASLPARPRARCLLRRCAIAAGRRRRSASSASSATAAPSTSRKCSTTPSWPRRAGSGARPPARSATSSSTASTKAPRSSSPRTRPSPRPSPACAPPTCRSCR